MALIDLHIHTTASDGLSGPAAIGAQVRAVGITTFSVTGHWATTAFSDFDEPFAGIDPIAVTDVSFASACPSISGAASSR
jgi:predicted metal-dependent phosphoesterase TrpH